MIRRGLSIALIAALALPQIAGAQDRRNPVIPILIGPNADTARVSVTVDKGLRSTKRLRTRALRQARRDMQAGEPISTEHLRALAEAGDGLAAQRYVRVLQADPAGADPSDIAFFAATAVGTGRIWTLKPMIAAMHQLDPATEPKARVNKYIRVLYPHAWAGNALALDALVAFNGEGRLFGPLSEATRTRILDEARKQGDGRTELALAMGLLETERVKPTPDPQVMAEVRGYLETAQASDHLAVRTTAQNLLRLIEGT